MNEHQYRHSDDWEPPTRDIEAITLMGSNIAEIALPKSENVGIRSTQLYQLGDWV